MESRDLLAQAAPVLPVASFHSDDHARACARLFAAAGVPALEVTLRHGDAWRHFAICRSEMPDALLGVGTVLAIEELESAAREADFAVSPGLDPRLCRRAAAMKLTYLPGVATPSEIMAAMDLGFLQLKYFPAVASSPSVLSAYRAVFPRVRFCPTGGIGADDWQDWVALENVPCVGGSWVVPSQLALEADPDGWMRSLRSLYG